MARSCELYFNTLAILPREYKEEYVQYCHIFGKSSFLEHFFNFLEMGVDKFGENFKKFTQIKRELLWLVPWM